MLALVTTAALTLASPTTLKNPPPLLAASQRLSYQYFASAWAPDNSSLYLASPSNIDCFIPATGRLEEGVYVRFSEEEDITAMAASTSGNIILGIGRSVVVVDYATRTGQVLKTFESHTTKITALAVSNDSTLIASASSNGVHIHDLLVPAKHTSLHLPTNVSASISTIMFHSHVRTRLLLCSSCDILVYDVAKPSTPVKTITIRQVVVDIACSSFSKALVAVASRTSVNLIDLDKEKGLFKTIRSPEQITSIIFSPEGAAIYIGIRDGIRILNLRELDKEMKRVSVSEVGQGVVCLAVQKRVKNGTSSASARRSSISNLSTTSSPRVRAGVVPNVRSPLQPVVTKKNVVSPIKIKSGVSETLQKQDPVKTGTQTKRISSHSVLSPSSRGTSNSTSVSRTRVSTSRENVFDDTGGGSTQSAAHVVASSPRLEPLGMHAGPVELTSTRLGSLFTGETRITSSSSTRSEISRKTNSSAGAKIRGSSLTRAPSTVSISSCKTRDSTRSDILANDKGIHATLSSPELPMDAVPLVSNAKIQSSGVTSAEQKTRVTRAAEKTRAQFGVSSATAPSGSKDKGKDKEVHVEAAAATDRDTDACDELIHTEEHAEGTVQQAPDCKISMQVTPRRSSAPNWVQPPNTLPMHSNASNAYELFQGLIADMQAKNHADIKALHIDMLRMGRGIRQEMEEWGGEVRKLREENAKLREENDRLRRGY